jgi:hypothetical protein
VSHFWSNVVAQYGSESSTAPMIYRLCQCGTVEVLDPDASRPSWKEVHVELESDECPERDIRHPNAEAVEKEFFDRMVRRGKEAQAEVKP